MGVLRTKLDELDGTIERAITSVNTEIKGIEGEIRTLTAGVSQKLEKFNGDMKAAKDDIFAKVREIQKRVDDFTG